MLSTLLKAWVLSVGQIDWMNWLRLKLASAFMADFEATLLPSYPHPPFSSLSTPPILTPLPLTITPSISLTLVTSNSKSRHGLIETDCYFKAVCLEHDLRMEGGWGVDFVLGGSGGG
jgi:hypothetical protein